MKHITSCLNIKIDKARRYLLLIIIIFLTNNHLIAQNDPTQLLIRYYSLKDALVAGEGTTAAMKANEIVQTLNGIDYKSISSRKTLVRDADRIANTYEIEKQRKYFENLSANMVVVANNVRPGTSPVYVLYCPMKKASWLNNSTEIRNPYYGTSMLTCGEVKETIQ